MKATLVFSALVCLGGASTVFAARFPEVGTLPRKELHFGSQRVFSGLSGSEQGLHISQEDVPLPDATAAALRTRPTTVSRPRSPELVQEARWMSMRDAQSMPVEWDTVVVNGPDVEDRYTLSQLARMTGNAYGLPGGKRWYDLDPAWNTSFPFGWEDAADGFRGHVFLSTDNSTVILSIKGTTLNGPSTKKDKFNDNLLFSCCCARVDIRWALKTVCDCFSGHLKCDSTCLSNALIEDSLFYSSGVQLVLQLQLMYPHATLWLVGHSLGGSLASLLGATFGLPAVAFEAPGEKIAAQRLHLPPPPAGAPVTHVYHNADPIAVGTCTGPLSVCEQAGYAIETKCHLGKSIVYDAAAELGWMPDVRHHVIREVITRLLDDDRDWEEGRQVPLAREEEDCSDCDKWKFGDFKSDR